MQEISPQIAAVHIALTASYLGRQLDQRYRLDRFLGEGASAWVFAGHDLRLERDVAVKVLKPHAQGEQAAARRRFVAEGRTLAKLVHPHVVLVHDTGETPDGLGYLVMELSEAGNLEADLCRRGTLPVEETLRLLLPLLGALACAHGRGIVHRDVKPANIILARDRGEACAKLLDFGIAKRPDTGASTDSAVGTPSYMAPEQARGESLSAANDVWAMGVVFFRCLSGHLPFDARSSAQTLLKLVQERAPLFAEACIGLGPHLAIALDRALEPDLQQRYSDARSFARALTKAAVQDGVQLPQHPDPIGLADFPLWLSDADVERTRPLALEERAQVAAVLASSPLPLQRKRRGPLLLALALLVVGAAAFVTSSAQRERVGARPVAEIVAAKPAAPSERPAPEPATTPSAVPAADVVSATAAAPRPADRSPNSAPTPSASRRKSKGKAATAVIASTAQTEGQASSAQPATKSGVIANWEW